MKYILDTNVCIYFLNGKSQRIRDQIASHRASELATTSITVAELYYGAYHSKRIAHDESFTLVTHNTSEFSRIEDLGLEDWY